MNQEEIEEHALMHYGILRKSGRYPWGSGEDAYQRSTDFFAAVADLKAKGLTDAEIAKGLGLESTTELRATNAIAKNQIRRANEAQALRLKDKGMSNVAIGARMGIPESSVRALLDPSRQARADVLTQTADMLKKQLETKAYLDIGIGSERYVDIGDGSAESIGIAKTKFDTAVAMLKDEGYKDYHVKVEQVGMPGKYTDVKVLCPPGTTYSELYQNRDKIQPIKSYTEDGGHTFEPIEPPKSFSSKRLEIRYGPDGGALMDGVIELRPGVPELSLGKNRYGQVRIAVDDTHYLKGMAMYAKDLPDGIDMRFNTNKKATANKLDALKPIKDDPENPFGSITRQRHYVDADGNRQLSVLNIVGSPTKPGSGEEGAWGEWSKNLSSQMLSKQPTELAKQQLDMAYRTKKEAFDEINSLNNPAIKKMLLDSFADDADSAAVHLKAAPLPGQGTHVILPIKDMKDNEIYAPNYRQGETVVLIRHPHGGTFEIPELRVNNRQKTAKALLGNSTDAVGINANVAARLSGADFDGDTVIVIPNANHAVKTSAPLEGLKNFSPSDHYPPYDGMKTIDGGIYHAATDKVEYGPKGPSGKTKQHEMGDISNLITDMTIKGAVDREIAQAVRHSMVVIDSEKHKLNYKQSFQDNGIASLKIKYQGKNGNPGTPQSGASTLISLAKSEKRVPERKLRRASEGGPIDPVTGEKVYTPTGNNYVQTKVNKRTGETIETVVYRTDKSSKMAETNDAHTLSSGRPIEEAYANHANRLKALANMARLESMKTPPAEYSPSAAKAYAKEVSSLNAKLNIAIKNKPLERQAQLLGNANVTAKKKANPNMDKSDLKKIKNQELTKARARVGANKQRVEITPLEWQAIQAGAVSNHKLVEILKNTDVDVVRQYATPRSHTGLSAAVQSRAKAMLARGYTQAEIAEQLGVSTNTLNKELKE